MTYGIDDDGFSRKPLNVIVSEIENGLQGEFGSDLQTDPTSPEGQIIGVLSGQIDELWQLAEIIYGSLSPEDASGAALDNVVSLNYLQRQDAEATTTIMTLNSTLGTTVPAGTTFSNEDTATSPDEVFEFTLDENTTISAGIPAQASATCTVTGPVEAADNTITTIVDVVTNLDSVTNSDSVVGNDVESDAELRARRQNSVGRSGNSQVDNIRSTVLSVTSVTSCIVVTTPNSTGADNQPQNSIRVIVEGGDDTEIAEAIFSKITAGIPTWSNNGTVVQVTDSQGTVHDIEFDRPIEVPIYVSVTAAILPIDQTYTAEALKQAIVDWGNQNIQANDNVYSGQLFTPANSVGELAITEILVGTTDPASNTQVDIQQSERAQWSVDNIDTSGVVG